MAANLNNLNPELHQGTYVFTSVPVDVDVSNLNIVASVRESEGLTLVLPEEEAIQNGFQTQFPCSWITLGLESALNSVGLTAAFASALAARSIPCNIIAGAHHDHLFVPQEQAEAAIQCLAEVQFEQKE